METKTKIIGILLTYKHVNLVEDIYRRLPKGVFDEVIIFDDASRDGIEKVAEKLNLPIFIQEKNLGYGGNIKYSLKKCVERGADYMVEIHGDGQYGADSIIPGLEKIKSGYDFVLGSRFTNMGQALRDKMPLLTYLANRGLSFFDRLVLQIPLTEFHTGFRVYSRKLVEIVDFSPTANDDLFSFQIIAMAKYHNLRIAEVPVRCDYGKDHTSITFRRAAKYAFQTFSVLSQYILARLEWRINYFTIKSMNPRFKKYFKFIISGASVRLDQSGVFLYFYHFLQYLVSVRFWNVFYTSQSWLVFICKNILLSKTHPREMVKTRSWIVFISFLLTKSFDKY